MVDFREVFRRINRALTAAIRFLANSAREVVRSPVWRQIAERALRAWTAVLSATLAGWRRIAALAETNLARRVLAWISARPVAARTIAVLTVLAILASVVAAVIPRLNPERPAVIWTMVNISVPAMLGDAHLLEFANGRTVLIDTGWETTARQYLLPFLQNKGIRRLERVIVTNAKDSKAGGLSALLESGIEIGSISFNIPPKELCDAERQWGCDYETILRRERHWARLSSVWPMETGQTLLDTDDATLSVFITHDGLSPPVGRSALADATSLLELQSGNNRVLFASDLGTTLGGYLADERTADLDFNILKVPHFGTWTHAPTRFFHTLLPKLDLALIPTIESQWASRRSIIVREELANVPTYLSERHGHVEVRLFRDRFEVTTQKRVRSTEAN